MTAAKTMNLCLLKVSDCFLSATARILRANIGRAFRRLSAPAAFRGLQLRTERRLYLTAMSAIRFAETTAEMSGFLIKITVTK